MSHRPRIVIAVALVLATITLAVTVDAGARERLPSDSDETRQRCDDGVGETVVPAVAARQAAAPAIKGQLPVRGSSGDGDRVVDDEDPCRWIDTPTVIATRPPPRKRGIVVTIGDSYAAGIGMHNNPNDYDAYPTTEHVDDAAAAGFDIAGNEDDTCPRDYTGTPGFSIAADRDMSRRLVACGGGGVFHAGEQWGWINHQLPGNTADEWKGDIVILVAGGNDLETVNGDSWPDLLKHCIKELYSGGCHEKDGNQIANFDAIEGDLEALIAELADTASDARIRVQGYPMLFRPTATKCKAVSGLSADEAAWADDQTVELNSRIESAVNAVAADASWVDLQYVDVVDELTTGACHKPRSEAHIHDKVVSLGASVWDLFASNASFHPTPLGWEGFLDAIEATLP